MVITFFPLLIAKKEAFTFWRRRSVNPRGSSSSRCPPVGAFVVVVVVMIVVVVVPFAGRREGLAAQFAPC